MNLFYTPQIEGNIHNLDEQESKHAVRVLRLVKGRWGHSGGWNGRMVQCCDHRGPSQAMCAGNYSHTLLNYNRLPYHLHMAISPTKNMDRFEWFLEKATEIGISEITPLMCHRTERKQVKQERLERILVSAMKQSLKAYKPLLSAPVQMTDFLKRDRGGTRGIAHCLPTGRISLSDMEMSGQYTMLVGPEGDFTEEEIEHGHQAGYRPVHLGDSRLRTETAGVHFVLPSNF